MRGYLIEHHKRLFGMDYARDRVRKRIRNKLNIKQPRGKMVHLSIDRSKEVKGRTYVRGSE